MLRSIIITVVAILVVELLAYGWEQLRFKLAMRKHWHKPNNK